jgi:aminoglycoside phosphotransferase (APT) family kinase protein
MAGEIRQPIDLESLSRYISFNVPEIALPIDIKQFGYGQSNPTYQLTAKDGKKYVMRKKPPGQLLSKVGSEREDRLRRELIDGRQRIRLIASIGYSTLWRRRMSPYPEP